MTGKGPFTWRLIGFLALALGLLAWTLSALGAFSYARGIHVSATFADASGLLVGSQVLVSGVPVGKVTSISLDERQQARVEMVIDEKVAISRDVEAVLRARSLLGEKVIALGLRLRPTDRHDWRLETRSLPPGSRRTCSCWRRGPARRWRVSEALRADSTSC